ncbi:hypothetical protein [Actinocrispum sp. NPDC049592]|uniref:hypothetical protein n=1 Tax=Actinocrispum sp. NPDC049592 TaxID=3154835 RepID=UPI00342C0546
MPLKHFVVVAAVSAAAAAFAPAVASAAPAVCTPSYLPIPATMTGGGTVSVADSQGGYAGEGYVNLFGGSRSTHILRWQGGQVTDYGYLTGFGDDATPMAVNRNGVVVGYAYNGSFPRALRSRGTVLEPLAVPADVDSSYATGINDAGDIVGYVGRRFQQGIMIYTVNTAVVWPAGAPGTVVALSGLPSTGQAKAVGIDQDGTVLVEYYPSRTDEFQATALYLWRAGTARKLTLPSGAKFVAGNTIANGRVGGYTQTSDIADTIGVLWDQNGTFLRPVNSAAVNSVNRSGQSIGYALDDTTGFYGVWQLGQQIASLDGALGVYVSADDGSIAGWSRGSETGAKNKPTVWRCG